MTGKPLVAKNNYLEAKYSRIALYGLVVKSPVLKTITVVEDPQRDLFHFNYI